MAGKEISRRGFLKGAAGVGAGVVGFPYIILSSALGKAGTVAPSNRITMGCIGLGGQGTSDMKSFLEKAEVQVVAVCDVNKKSGGYLGTAWGGWGPGVGGREPARRLVEEHYAEKSRAGSYKGCSSYRDFREVLARDDIDAVLIGTPDHWHALIGVAAARAGKDIYCEKPLAYSVAEGRAICDAVEKNSVVWQTGSQQRSDRNFRFACELVRNGRIGDVGVVKVGLIGRNSVHNKDKPDLRKVVPVPEGFDYDMWLGPAPLTPYCAGRCHFNFRWISDYAGGQITDWAGHHIDIAQWAMGVETGWPIEVQGKGVFCEDELYDTVEDYRFECRYEGGFKIIVKGENTATGGIRFEGSDGWVYVTRNSLEAQPASLLDTVIRPDEIHLYKSDNHIQNFLDCVRKRSQTVARPEIAQRSITTGLLGIISMKLGRKLRWDGVAERFIDDSEADRYLRRPMRSPWHI